MGQCRGGAPGCRVPAAGRRHRAVLQLRRRGDHGRRPGRRDRGARGECPGDRLSRVDQAPDRPRAHRRADAPVARTDLRDSRSDRHAERRHPAAGDAGAEDRRAGVGGGHGSVSPRRRRRDPVRPSRRHRRGLRGGVPQLARGRAPGDRRFESSEAAGATTSARCSSETDRNVRVCARRPRGSQGVVFTGAVPHASMPACLAACDIGVAPFDIGAHRDLALGFYWSPLKIFEYMAAGLPVVAPAADRIPTLVEHEREGLLYPQGDPGALASALERLIDARLRARLGSAARDRAVRDVQLGRALPGTGRGVPPGAQNSALKIKQEVRRSGERRERKDKEKSSLSPVRSWLDCSLAATG